MLEVSTSGYYGWCKRTASKRARQDAMLTEYIRTIHERSKGTYGAPRIHAELRAHGVSVGRKRVARLMSEAGLQGVSRRRGTRTTLRNPRAHAAPDLVERNFTAAAPDGLWVSDITADGPSAIVPTASGFIYLAVTLDAFSRRVVGWSMAGHLRTELVLSALDMALARRKTEGVIHHSDQGRQYTALAFGERCKKAGVGPSTRSVGDCYDNAMCESFFATLECELLDRRRFDTKAEARMAVFEYIEGWYNPHRRHSAPAYASPIQYERQHHAAAVSLNHPVSTEAG